MTPHPYSAALAEAFDLAQLDAGARQALAEADLGPLWRVTGGWRRNGTSPRLRKEAVAMLQRHGLLQASGPGGARVLTHLGRALAVRLSKGRRRA